MAFRVLTCASRSPLYNSHFLWAPRVTIIDRFHCSSSSGSSSSSSATYNCSSLFHSHCRTCHSPRSVEVTLTRYTERINPEPLGTVNGCTDDGDNHIYSTLNQDSMGRGEMGSLPPPPPMVHPETSFNRKDSRSCLMEDIDGKSTSPVPFQLVHGGTPEPYQIAVNSRENLASVGITEGIERNPTNQTLVSMGSGSSQPSITGMGTPSSPYEQIEKRYGPNEFSISSSSPKIPNRRGSAGVGIGGGSGLHHAMPLRKTVSGPFIRGKPHPGPFKRHMSEKLTEGGADDNDYSHLDRTLPSTPTSVPAPQKRGQSTSSFTMMTPSPIVTTSQSAQHHHPPHHQLPRPDNKSKRNSITNYSRSSPSPTDSHDSTSFAMRNLQTLTPTSEGPPPYESESSPYSPSESSMFDNGAYEGVVHPQQQPQPMQMQVAMAHQRRLDSARSEESLSKNQQQPPWYHNASDISLNNRSSEEVIVGNVLPQQRSRINSNITPYSQVSNTEIDSRRRDESSLRVVPTPGSSPMFTINADSVPMGYSPPRSTMGSLARVPNSHLHTVVV